MRGSLWGGRSSRKIKMASLVLAMAMTAFLAPVRAAVTVEHSNSVRLTQAAGLLQNGKFSDAIKIRSRTICFLIF